MEQMSKQPADEAAKGKYPIIGYICKQSNKRVELKSSVRLGYQVFINIFQPIKAQEDWSSTNYM